MMRIRDSLSSRYILSQEDDSSRPQALARYACFRRREPDHTEVTALRKPLSGYDAICRHALTRPQQGGEAGLRCSVRMRGRIPSRAGCDSGLLSALPRIRSAGRAGNGAERSWPGRRGYRKPICAMVFATVGGSRAPWLSCAQRETNPRSSSTCASAGHSATTSFAGGAAKASGFSGPRMLRSRPSGDTAIAALLWCIAPAIPNSPGSVLCHHRTGASTKARNLPAQRCSPSLLWQPTSAELSSHWTLDRGRKAVA